MKTAIFLIMVFIGSNLQLLGQVKRHLPLIIIIDGQIATTGIEGGFFLIKDSVNKVTDSVEFGYRVSQATTTEAEYKKLRSLDGKSKVVIRFRYSPFQSITNTSHVYQCSIDGNWVNDVYLILKVYNYSNKVNYRYFDKRKGYGIEEEIPGSGTILLSRIKKSPLPW